MMTMSDEIKYVTLRFQERLGYAWITVVFEDKNNKPIHIEITRDDYKPNVAYWLQEKYLNDPKRFIKSLIEYVWDGDDIMDLHIDPNNVKIEANFSMENFQDFLNAIKNL